jgi:uncharacterized protein
MKIEFDPAKRALTFETRGVDMEDAPLIFAADNITFEDGRKDYGERRMTTVGILRNRMIILVWTQRGRARRIISMRKANDREKELYGKRLGRS